MEPTPAYSSGTPEARAMYEVLHGVTVAPATLVAGIPAQVVRPIEPSP